MPSEIVEPTQEMIERSANRLRMGQLVVFPTETVYGIAGDPFNIMAVGRVFELKKRDKDKPLPLQIAEIDWLPLVAQCPDELRERLAKVWPGPLTAVLPASHRIALSIT